ncbi:MAG: lysophospholipid acyltransferase family protein [Deltaproteobacteria bacterium]|nr:lysophospholipid acyltransferase family protein [Deltaproteobacteria bacterium]
MNWKPLKRGLRHGLLRVALGVVSALPLDVAADFGRAFGGLAFHLLGKQRRLALEGLARAFPEWTEGERRRVAKACFRHLGQAAFELACARKLDLQAARLVEWPAADRALLDEALAEGNGVVFVTGHVGNWELLARTLGRAGYPCQTIAKETTDARTTALLERFRARGGIRTIWRGAEGAARAMLRALRGGEVLGLLIDQDTRVQSLFVPFFGHLASTPRAAADLALRTGAAVVTGYCHRQGEQTRYRISMCRIRPPASTGDREADALGLTAVLTADIERAIREAPAQWVWMHRRWKSRP